MFRILLADDSRTTQKIVRLALGEDRFELQEAADGETALARLRESTFHVLIADAALPGIDGCSLARRVKQEPELANLPVILLGSAYAPVEPERVEWSGAEAVLSKPFDTLEFVRLVEELATRRQEEMEQAAASPGGDEVAEENLAPPDPIPLELPECRAAFRLPPRRVWTSEQGESGKLSEAELEKLAEEVARRLPEALRDLVPELLRRRADQ
ncbi:MAG: hypothetical protein Kow00109_15380 [Acidobacteriota bacterium]